MNFRALSQTVRLHDYGAFVTGVFAPRASKDAYFAVQAFAAELAGVRFAVRGNIAAGRMRLQWWRGLVDDAYKGQPPPHLVGAHLAAAVREHSLTRAFFLRQVDARDDELEWPQPETLGKLEERAEALGALPLYLSLESYGVPASDHGAAHAASHVGKAAALAAVLQNTRRMAAEGLVALPGDVLAKHGAKPDDVLLAMEADADALGRLIPVFFEVAALANSHAEHARELAGEVSAAAAPALMVAAPTWRYLQTLQECEFNVFDPRLETSDLGTLMRAWRLSGRGFEGFFAP